MVELTTVLMCPFYIVVSPFVDLVKYTLVPIVLGIPILSYDIITVGYMCGSHLVLSDFVSVGKNGVWPCNVRPCDYYNVLVEWCIMAHPCSVAC